MTQHEIISVPLGTSPAFLNRTKFFDQERVGNGVDGKVALGVVREEVDATKNDPTLSIWSVVERAIYHGKFNLPELRQLHLLLLTGAQHSANSPAFDGRSLVSAMTEGSLNDQHLELGVRNSLGWLKQAGQISERIATMSADTTELVLPTLPRR